jgi:predicted transcriptional regulator
VELLLSVCGLERIEGLESQEQGRLYDTEEVNPRLRS